MAPYEIEDTSDWLGNPTPLETCRHQLRMYENEFEKLNLQLSKARQDIFAIKTPPFKQRRTCLLVCIYLPYIDLACRKCNQSVVTCIGDGDNSLSMRWVKSGTRSSMTHAAGGGIGWHSTQLLS
jgi:hypothetical protein